MRGETKVKSLGIWLKAAAISLLMAGLAFSEEQSTVSSGKPVEFRQWIGQTDAWLEPTIFPKFYADDSENPGCATTDVTGKCNNVSKNDRWTSTSVAGAKWAKDIDPAAYKQCKVDCGKKNCIDTNGDGKLNKSDNCNWNGCAKGTNRKCDSSGNCEDTYRPCKQGYYNGSAFTYSAKDLEEGEYQYIPGLPVTPNSSGEAGEVSIASIKGYRGINKMLFTWNVRVEGTGRELQVWPFICHPHHGTSYQKFLPGQLKTRLYVKSTASGNGVKNTDKSYIVGEYVPVGISAEITMPKVKSTSVTNPGDPTITGGYLLTKDDFEQGKFPPEVYFQVRWYNDSCVFVKSPKGQRNVVVTIFPVTATEDISQ